MHPDVPAAIAKLERAHAARQQRKMVNIDVVETSAVDHPAHGHEAWLVLKSAGNAAAHNHLVDAHYLNAQEQETARAFYRTDVLKSGESVQNGQATIRRDTCGCLYMVTSEAMEKAADADLVRELAQNRRGRTPDWILGPEEVAQVNAFMKSQYGK